MLTQVEGVQTVGAAHGGAEAAAGEATSPGMGHLHLLRLRFGLQESTQRGLGGGVQFGQHHLRRTRATGKGKGQAVDQGIGRRGGGGQRGARRRRGGRCGVVQGF